MLSVTKLVTWYEIVAVNVTTFVSPVGKSPIFLFVLDIPRVVLFTKRDPSHIGKSRIKSEPSLTKGNAMNNNMITSSYFPANCTS